MRPLLPLALALSLSGQLSAQCFVEKLHQSEIPLGYEFGGTTAVTADYAVVGAPRGGGVSGPGRVYVYRREGNSWVEDAVLQGDNPSAGGGGPGDQFGGAAALGGERVVVGAPWEWEGQLRAAGAVYVFRRDASGWIKEARLVDPTPAEDDLFGKSVALSGDILVAGAPTTTSVAAQEAHVFRLSGTAWSLEQTIAPTAPALDTYYGSAVAIDGDLLLVGARGKPVPMPKQGVVYAYRYYGTMWNETQQLQPFLKVPGDSFGGAISMDGQRALIAAPLKGLAWIFELEGSLWKEQELLATSLGSLSVSLDGDQALIGMPAAGPFVESGTVILFQFDGLHWNQAASLTAYDQAQGDRFGWAVALGGGHLLVGSYHDDDGAIDSGSAHVYEAFQEVLISPTSSISLSTGGVQQLKLRAGVEDAGALYLLAVTSSGTCPGFFLGEVFIPANVDPFTTYSIAHANQPPFVNTFGTLDQDGLAQASIQIPAGVNHALAGLTLNHAFVVIDPVTLAVLSASNAVKLSLLP